MQQADLQVNGVRDSSIPNACHFGVPIIERVTDDDGAEVAIFRDGNGGCRKPIGREAVWTIAVSGFRALRFVAGSRRAGSGHLSWLTLGGAGAMVAWIARGTLA